MAIKQVLEIELSVYRRLQALANPLEDTIESLLTRLIDHYTGSVGSASLSGTPKYFVTDRSAARLPIGLKLFANYKKKLIEAEVNEYGIFCEGHTYQSPTAAAVAVKIKRGMTEQNSQSNGWLFWRYRNPSGKAVPLDLMRRNRI